MSIVEALWTYIVIISLCRWRVGFGGLRSEQTDISLGLNWEAFIGEAGMDLFVIELG